MTQWKKVKIGDFLKRKRIHVVLDETAKYKLLTVRLYHKGIVLREEKSGALIKSNMYQVSKGDFILSGIDARNGAFGIVPEELDGAIVTNDFWYFDIDESIIKREYFLWLTTTPIFLDACQKASKGETQRIRLQKDAFFNYEINCPTIGYQDEFLSTIVPVIDNINELKKETEKQTELVKQLRASILQDAIEGKITADWREKHPVKKGDPDFDAEALFEKIQAEKQEKGKKQKPLLAITEDEKPFEIPEGWKWVRLGEICRKLTDGSHNPPPNISKGYPVISAMNIKNGGISLDNVARYTDEVGFQKENTRTQITKGDIIMGIIGASIGNVAIYQYDQKVIAQRSIAIIDTFIGNLFVSTALNSTFIQKYLRENAFGSAQGGIYLGKISNIPFPLPSLAEQKEIVTRVERHLETVGQIEKQTEERERLAKQLMQGILKEAFE